LDPAKPWVALMDWRGARSTTPKQELEAETRGASLGQFSRKEDVCYTTRKRGVEEERVLSTSEDGRTCELKSPEQKPKRKRKYRKATHTIRKVRQ
jgi:hypothetical protein